MFLIRLETMAHDDSKTMTICKFFPCSIYQKPSVVWLLCDTSLFFLLAALLTLVLPSVFLFQLLLLLPVSFHLSLQLFRFIIFLLFRYFCSHTFVSFLFVRFAFYAFVYTLVYKIHVFYYISLVYRFLSFSLFPFSGFSCRFKIFHSLSFSFFLISRVLHIFVFPLHKVLPAHVCVYLVRCDCLWWNFYWRISSYCYYYKC